MCGIFFSNGKTVPHGGTHAQKNFLLASLLFFVNAFAEDIREFRFYNDVFSEYTWVSDEQRIPELKKLIKPEHLALFNNINRKIKLVERNGNSNMGMDICMMKYNFRQCDRAADTYPSVGWGLCTLAHNPVACSNARGTYSSLGFGICSMYHSPADCTRYGDQAPTTGWGLCTVKNSPRDCAHAVGTDPSLG